MRRVLLAVIIVFSAFSMLTQLVSAAAFPTKQVEVIVPWSAGGATDVLFRAIANVFPKHANGQPMVIKNIPGGGAVTGTMEFVKSKPDGYTGLGIATPIITKMNMSKVPFNMDSFEPVIMVVENPCMIMVRADSKFKNLRDFIEAARKNPGAIGIGNGGAGGGTHIVALAFEDFAGVEFLHVPYQGGGPAIIALLGGHIDSVMASAPEGISNAEAGQLRILGVLGPKRLARFPDVPTAAEQGFDFSLSMWRGICVPKGTPKATVKALHDILLKCIEDPEFKRQGDELAIEIVYKGPEDYGEYMRAEDKFYNRLIKVKGLEDK